MIYLHYIVNLCIDGEFLPFFYLGGGGGGGGGGWTGFGEHEAVVVSQCQCPLTQ